MYRNLLIVLMLFDEIGLRMVFYLMRAGRFLVFSSRRRHTTLQGDWSSDVFSSDLPDPGYAVSHGGIAQSHAELRFHAPVGKASRFAHERKQFRGKQARGFLARDARGPSQPRSEERRVGKEGRSRWSPYH